MAHLKRKDLMMHSHSVRLRRAGAADGCVATEIGIFIFFCTTYFCRTCLRQMHVM